MTRTVRRAVTHGIVGGAIVLLVGAVVFLEDRPNPEPWHTVHLDEEFTADAGVASLDEYLALEERLFAQLDREVYGAQTPDETGA